MAMNNSNGSISGSGSGKKKRSLDFQNRKVRRRIWQEDEVHKLIAVWGSRLDDLRQSKKNRHIYEEISQELNRMGLDTIREEVHIKIQNLSQLYRNEKRRIEETGESPTWLYYHEVNELLGSNEENTMDSTMLDESIGMNSFKHSEVVSVGDSGSENEIDDRQLSSTEDHDRNGYENQSKIRKIWYEQSAVMPSPSTSHASSSKSVAPAVVAGTTTLKQSQITSSNSNERKPMMANTTSLDALLQAIDSSTGIDQHQQHHHHSNQQNLSPNNIQLEILKEIRKTNALAEIEHREAKMLHQEMKELEEQRFNLTQMFIERSLTLQKQMLDSLRMANRSGGSTGNATSTGRYSMNAKSTNNGVGGGGLNAVSSASDHSFKFLPRTQSSRPQFVLGQKKKKSN